MVAQISFDQDLKTWVALNKIGKKARIRLKSCKKTNKYHALILGGNYVLVENCTVQYNRQRR